VCVQEIHTNEVREGNRVRKVFGYIVKGLKHANANGVWENNWKVC